VLIIQSKTCLDSSILLSVVIFFMDIISFLGIRSDSFKGQEMAFITRGTAVLL